MSEIIVKFRLIIAVLVSILIIIFFIIPQTNKKTKPELIDHGHNHGESPLVMIMPHTDINGPFTIEYVTTKDDVDYIKVTDSSPQGRVNALHWLRENGINPTNLNIEFDDFINPLEDGGD